ncbi:MAG TPA: ABC transporter permease [Candidatus Sulfotelmatobacter sp.]|nr:ABC transporter permease [Candidatus Sulfotelmatobacter sp.]
MILRNLAIAVRVLTRSPQFTLTAVVTIALGLGASAAIFSVANAVLLQPIPYRDPDRLVIAGMELRQRHVRDLQFSNADYIDLRDGTKEAFEDFGGVFTFRGVIPREDGTAEQVRNAIVTTNFFRLTGARIALGRDFQDEDGIPQAQPIAGTQAGPQLPLVAIVSYEYFQRRFGANAAILGHPMQAGGGQPGPLIVGVLAPGFRLYFPPEANEEAAPDIWVANRLDYDAANRIAFSIRPIGRLKPGVSLERAQKAADRVAAETRKNFVISGTAGYFIDLEPLRQHLVANVRPAILALMGSAIFLLLIACANVANLLLVRASLRERELAVRAAIGADRWRLLVPLLSEAVVLAVAGTVAGLALAWIGIQVLVAVAPPNLPRMEAIRIDFFVLGFTALACLAATAIFGLVPAWRASRPGVANLLRGSSRNAGLLGGNRLRSAVVMVEVALSFVLLVGSGLMLRSFFQLQHTDPGFDARQLLTFQVVGANGGGDTPDARAAFVRRIQDRLGAIPGVESVAASSPFPLAGGFSPIRWGTGEALADASKFQATDFEIVLPGYFETLRVPLLAGRTFTDQDNLPHRDFVIIDDILAKKAFHGESAVGKRILIRVRSPQPEWVEVIGVIAHQHATSLATPGREQVYFTDAFVGSGRIDTWAIRTGNDPTGYGNAVRSAIRELDPHLLVTEMQPAEFLLYKAQGGTRFSLLLIGVFAAIAGVLAGVGLYGVLATTVRQRTSEIGVRMALGAEPGRIFQLVVGEGFRLSALGIVIGLIAAFGLTRLMNAMLVGVKATDPATFGAMAIVFLLIGAAASWLPARRAAALDPTSALREE